MPAPLSIVIPTLNGEDRIGPTVASLFEGVSQGLVAELIIVDGAKSAEMARIAEEVGAKLITARPGRGHQLRTGAEAARGAWMLFLHDDSRLSEGWANCVAAHIANNRKAGFFRLRFDASGFAPALVAGWANLRSRLFALPYGDQGLLISRDTYDRVGGYAAVPLMEDVLMARALGRRHIRVLDVVVRTSAERYEREGWFVRGLRNMRTLMLFSLRVPPEVLVKRYPPRQS